MADEEKKLIIDEDWKQQAQKEKEALKAKDEEEKKEAPTKAAEDSEQEGPGPLPQGDLAGLVNMLTTQALFAMGVLQVKGQEGRAPDMDMARYNIDMLEALQEKTKGNLSEQEETALKNTLSELRMGYVQIASQGPPQPEQSA